MALKAREVLILGQMPSYEERLVQMESVLKNSVSNAYYGESVGTTKYVSYPDSHIFTSDLSKERPQLKFSESSLTLDIPSSMCSRRFSITKIQWSVLVSNNLILLKLTNHDTSCIRSLCSPSIQGLHIAIH